MNRLSALAFFSATLLLFPFLAWAGTEAAFSGKGYAKGPILNYEFLSGALDSRLTFSRSSTAAYFNSSGNLAIAAANVPRFDYDPSSLDLKGLLFEESRTNFVTYARDFTNAAWVKTNMTAAKNATGIDGVASSASTLTATAANATVLISVTDANTNQKYFSVYVKRKTGSGDVQLSVNSGASWVTVPVSSSWTKVGWSSTTSSPSVGLRLVTSGDAVYVDCAQLEEGRFATSPIITSGATGTRQDEYIQNDNISSWYKTAQGSVAMDFISLDWQNLDSFPWPYAFHNSDWTTGMGMYFHPYWDAVVMKNYDTSSNNNEFSFGSMVPGKVLKTAYTYGTNYGAASVNHFVTQTSTATVTPGAMTSLYIGGGDNYFSGWIRRFRYWNRPLSTTELQRVTSVPKYGSIPSYSVDLMRGEWDYLLGFSRSSTATYYGPTGLLETASADTPRMDYDPSTLQPKGLLLEPSRTNYVKYSRDLSGSNWNLNLATGAKDATGIDGVASSASTLTATSANGYATRSTSITGSAIKVFSVYLKRKTGTGAVQLTVSGDSNWMTVPVTDSWTRFSMTTTAASPKVGVRLTTANDAVYFDCAQFEVGSVATMPIITTSATATRAYEYVYTNPDWWFTMDQGSFTFQAIPAYVPPAGEYPCFGGFVNETDFTERDVLYFDGDAGTTAVWVYAGGGTTNENLDLTTIPANATVKIGMRYQSGNYGFVTNGGTVTTDTATGIASGFTTLFIGYGTDSVGFFGWIQKFNYYDTALTDAQLQAATQ